MKLLELYNESLAKELILMVGIPAAGKSTYIARELSEYKIISPDSFIPYTDEEPWTPNRAKSAWAQSDMELNNSWGKYDKIAFDATFTFPRMRKKYIEWAKDNGYKVKAIYFEISPEEAKRRNLSRAPARRVPEETIDRMLSQLVPPSKSEGFDEVIKA